MHGFLFPVTGDVQLHAVENRRGNWPMDLLKVDEAE